MFQRLSTTFHQKTVPADSYDPDTFCSAYKSSESGTSVGAVYVRRMGRRNATC
jgi:hypothetical protein